MTIASIVLCAGKGTRMKSQRPKMLFPLLGKPLALWSLERAAEACDGPILAVVGHGGEEVENVLAERFGDRVQSVVQAEQLGTGHAVSMAMPHLAPDVTTLFVLCGDTPLLRSKLLKTLALLKEESQAPLAMATTWLEDPTGYGRIVRDDTDRVCRIVEEKDASDAEKAICEVNPAIYAFDAAFLRQALTSLNNQNAQGEFYLTDLIAMAAEATEGGIGVPTLPIPPEETIGVNDRVQLAEVTQILRARILRKHMEAGVTMEDPATTYIDAEVTIGRDVHLAPGVQIRGRSQIGENVKIDGYSILTDTMVADGATLDAHCVCEEAVIGPNAKVGPFARLRPLAKLHDGAKVGNFVEVKKAELHPGAKVNHLAYIGDAQIGENANIGAGTITCNYDGKNKHLTTVGKGVFVGSNSTLVAPIHLGDLSYVAAGSTLTKDAPPSSLAVGRARQENKEAYAERIRRRINASSKKD